MNTASEHAPALYLADVGELRRFAAPEVKAWAAMNRALGRHASLVDRAGVIDAPFRIGIHPSFEFGAVAGAPSLSYEECCERRARELLDLQEALGVPLALLYSGGVGSTLALVSLAKLLSDAQLRERVHVCLSPDSIAENPRFWFDFIRRRCTVRASDDLASLFDGNHLVVGGGHNDQLFGADAIAGLARRHPVRTLQYAYTRQRVTGLLAEAGLDPGAADCWFELVEDHVRRLHAPVATVYDFFWWIGFIFEWQAAHFRLLLRAGKAGARLDQVRCELRYHQFYSPPYFQKWALSNPELKIRDTWASCKFPAKDLIYAFNKDDEYRRDKLGVASMDRLFLHRHAARGMTADFGLLDTVREPSWYNPANSFRGAGAIRYAH